MRIVDVPGYGNAADTISIDDFLKRPLFAHLATPSSDGPRDSPVWFIWEQNSVWIIANARDTFPFRIEVDGRCAIGIVDFDVNTGRVQHVGMRGNATVEPWDAERAERLLSRYLGSDHANWDGRFRSTPSDTRNRWVRFTPDTVVIRDQSYPR